MITLKPCGECTACCEGYVESYIYGNHMKLGKNCVFLVDKKCCVYNDRPEVCRKFQCAWSQGIIDDELRPDKCGLLVYVKQVDKNNQDLIAIEMNDNVKYSNYSKLFDDVKKLNTNLNIVYHENLNNKDYFKPKNKVIFLKREVK